MTKLGISKALLEVWDWKDQCYRDVAHMPLNDALARRIKDAKRTAESLPVRLPMAKMPRRLAVAESSATYTISSRKKKRTKSGEQITDQKVT